MIFRHKGKWYSATVVVVPIVVFVALIVMALWSLFR